MHRQQRVAGIVLLGSLGKQQLNVLERGGSIPTRCLVRGGGLWDGEFAAALAAGAVFCAPQARTRLAPQRAGNASCSTSSRIHRGFRSGRDLSLRESSSGVGDKR